MGLRAYLVAFLLVAGVVGLGYRGADRWWSSIGCLASPPEGQFLAYCGAPQFGDYEHGAYYFNLEPDAVARLKQSDVMVFGTSRAQVALSTRAWSDFIRARGMSAYLAGFGFAEAGAFPLALIRKFELKPKAVVVLADPFFRNRSSSHIRVTQPLRWRVVPEAYEFVQKKLFIAAGARFCEMRPASCATTQPVVYRSRDDGTWHPSNFDLAPKFAIGEAGGNGNFTAGMAAADVEFAQRFIAATGVTKACVVLSAAPSPVVNSDAYVAEMGKLLGVSVALPKLRDLTSYDGNHLTPESAERWSAALLSEIGETLARCVRG